MKKFLTLILIFLSFLAGGYTVSYILWPSQRLKINRQLETLQQQLSESMSFDEEELEIKPARNVILLIGDGMGLAQVSAGMAVNNNQLQLERCTQTGLSKTSAANKYITDSAAAGTAMSSGKKTNNGMIAMTPDLVPTQTILEIAEEQGLGTGLVSTSTITHATPASFIAHQKNRNSYEAIAADFLRTDIDVVIGGGMGHFVNRKDEQNLVEQLQEKGYEVYDHIDAVVQANSSKFYGLCAEKDMPSMPDGRGDFLPKAVETAIRTLSSYEEGFFLMAEASQIDWGGHANNAEYVVTEMLDFDQTIGQVLDFAQENGETLVIITADHETGGLSITDVDQEQGEVELEFSSRSHTPIMVPVFTYGPGAEAFSGVYENTEIFHKMLAALGWKEEKLPQPTP